MHISYLTDEAHDDFAKALEAGASWGLRWAEIRSIDGVGILELTDEQVKRAKKLLDDHGMRVSALATPYLKCALPGHVASETGRMHNARELTYEEHLALFKRGVELAHAFETDRIRIFSFWRTEGAPFWDALSAAADATVAAVDGTGITACLENEGACFIGTSEELAEAARRLTDPRLKFIWDPGNSTYRGMPPRAQDFEVFASRIGHVHIKEARLNPSTGKYEPTVAGQGDTGYREHLPLIAAHYDDALTMEPHYHPDGDLTEGMRQAVEALRSVAADCGLELG